ncbi:MAG: hypothetical protein EHM50_08610 [Lysobacterales bacterium]|nr:MAG: hypothetical protein EHM50_08610 [Xanthomonadales bacterium]
MPDARTRFRRVVDRVERRLSATVNLASVGTLDWARWPGYKHKSNLISNVTTTGTFKTYSTSARIIDGNAGGIKVAGPGASFLWVAATTVGRTLTYYIAGWNSIGRVTGHAAERDHLHDDVLERLFVQPVTGLARGTWYFVVTALNAQGLESSYSNAGARPVP